MIKFTKMHGIGNSYIYINCFEEEVLIRQKCLSLFRIRTLESEATA